MRELRDGQANARRVASVSMRISKSKFVAGMQCLKRLYLQIRQPELGAEQGAAAEAIIKQGREVGMLARQLFPGGVEVGSEGGLDQAIRATQEFVANHEVPAIFEGVFEHDGVLVRVDVLQRRRGDLWRLVEVKSASDLKDNHVEDIAIQSYVLSGSGMKVTSVWLAHINRDYVLNGTTVDPRQFFLFRNLTDRANNLRPELVIRLRSQMNVLAGPTPPEVPTGQHCVSPVVCEFFHHCNRPLPDDHIGYFPWLHASAMEQLEGMGVESIQRMPDDSELSEFQRRVCDAMKTGQSWFSEDLKTEFESLKYPLYFMDLKPSTRRFLVSWECALRSFAIQFSVHVQPDPSN